MARWSMAPPESKPLPAWLLQTWGDRTKEARAHCEAHHINPLLVIKFRAWLNFSQVVPLSLAEMMEISTWRIEDDRAAMQQALMLSRP